jgi:CBS domain-containing protein
MSAPLVAVSPAAFAFEAVLEMTRWEIHHLAVVDAGRLVGVISTYDLLRLQAAHPVTLAREISRATSLEALAKLAERITPLVRQLMGAGGTPYDVGQIVAELNDRLTQRILGLTTDGLAANGESPPVPFCWLALGSEARREQTLRTDLDNGLVYADPPPELAPCAAAYYTKFAEAAIQGLVTVGFPPCPAELMASNPEWCQPLSVWSDYFRRWMKEAWPAQAASAVVLFDLRPIAGDRQLADALLQTIRTEAPGNRTFLSLLAREAIADDSPITLWGKVVVERRGPHRGALDLKQTGVQQLVGAGRVHALEFGLSDMNTLDRIRAAARQGVYTDDELQDIIDAYQFLMRLRLQHQLTLLERGAPPDNWIEPARLARADAALLREALRMVEHVKATVRKRYGLGRLPGL